MSSRGHVARDVVLATCMLALLAAVAPAGAAELAAASPSGSSPVVVPSPPPPAPPPKAKANRYTGATYGLALLGGPTVLNDDALGSRLGFVVGVASRMTGLLQLSDVELGYALSRSSPTGPRGEVGVLRHGISATMGLHPLFLAVLGNRWSSYVLSSLHLDIGGSYHLTTLGFGGDSKTRGDIGWQWGGGLDLPLQDPNQGSSLWLGLRYRQVRVNTDLANDRIHNVGEHQLLLTLEHRWNWR